MHDEDVSIWNIGDGYRNNCIRRYHSNWICIRYGLGFDEKGPRIVLVSIFANDVSYHFCLHQQRYNRVSVLVIAMPAPIILVSNLYVFSFLIIFLNLIYISTFLQTVFTQFVKDNAFEKLAEYTAIATSLHLSIINIFIFTLRILVTANVF